MNIGYRVRCADYRLPYRLLFYSFCGVGLFVVGYRESAADYRIWVEGQWLSVTKRLLSIIGYEPPGVLMTFFGL